MVLKEGVSDMIFHFTTIDGLLGMMKTGYIKFSSLMSSNDYQTTKKYPFYLSVSRTKSPKLGYGRMLSTLSYAVLYFDGRKINSRFHSDRFIYTNFGKTSKNFEYEDRIYSKEAFVKLTDLCNKIEISGEIPENQRALIKEYCQIKNIELIDNSKYLPDVELEQVNDYCPEGKQEINLTVGIFKFLVNKGYNEDLLMTQCRDITKDKCDYSILYGEVEPYWVQINTKQISKLPILTLYLFKLLCNHIYYKDFDNFENNYLDNNYFSGSIADYITDNI